MIYYGKTLSSSGPKLTAVQTNFELLDLSRLISSDTTTGGKCRLIFYNSSGRFMFDREFTLDKMRTTLKIDELVGQDGEYGTFCCLHEISAEKIIGVQNCHVAERGYISYRYKAAAPFRHMHGNFDAICESSKNNFQMLGGASRLKRIFQLQLILSDNKYYELAVVNTTRKIQNIRLVIKNSKSRNQDVVEDFQLDPRGSRILKVEGKYKDGSYLAIESKMVMARPVVFEYLNGMVDVYHG